MSRREGIGIEESYSVGILKVAEVRRQGIQRHYIQNIRGREEDQGIRNGKNKRKPQRKKKAPKEENLA